MADKVEDLITSLEHTSNGLFEWFKNNLMKSNSEMMADKVEDLITSLEHTSNGLFEWFKNNLLKCNSEKCHLLVSTNDRE